MAGAVKIVDVALRISKLNVTFIKSDRGTGPLKSRQPLSVRAIVRWGPGAKSSSKAVSAAIGGR
jgi:hypothetical protein